MVVDWKAKKSGDQKVPKNEKSHTKAPRYRSFSLGALNLCLQRKIDWIVAAVGAAGSFNALQECLVGRGVGQVKSD